MVVRIRLARFGRKREPFYNIVVAQARTARNSKPIEVIGTYDPLPKTPLSGKGKYKDIKLDTPRAKYWLGVGAQPSDPAWRILSLAGIVEPKYRPGMTPPAEGERLRPQKLLLRNDEPEEVLLESPVEQKIEALAEEIRAADLLAEERQEEDTLKA